MLENILNAIFSPVLKLNPMLGIFIISSLVTFIISIINKKVMGSTSSKGVKDKMQKIRGDLLEAQKSGNKEKVDEEMKKMMEMNSEYLHSMIKPLTVSLVISMLFVILFYPWLTETYNGKILLTLPEAFPIIGGKGVTWVVWYILCSVLISIALKKIMGI